MVYVTPGYFETLGIPLLRGRAFRDSDIHDAPPVAIVSQSFAQRVYKGVDAALGRHVAINNVSCEIAGVVGDVQQHSGLELASRPMSVEPTVYAPMAQSTRGFLYFVHRWLSPKWVVRSSGSAARIAPKIQAEVAAVDAELPVSGFRTMDEIEGLVSSAAAIHDGAIFHDGGAGASPGRDRALWPDLERHRAAHARTRRPHGAGRDGGADRCGDSAAWNSFSIGRHRCREPCWRAPPRACSIPCCGAFNRATR